LWNILFLWNALSVPRKPDICQYCFSLKHLASFLNFFFNNSTLTHLLAHRKKGFTPEKQENKTNLTSFTTLDSEKRDIENLS